MTLNQITTAVHSANGEVLLCGSTPFGFIVRANISGHSCRIIRLPSGKSPRNIPPEPGCQTHVASDAESLQTWLYLLSKSTSKEAEIIF